MGVHGLWELLAPVGRRVSVETLAGKKVAIDASIWMIQFMKAMRDEKGEMVRNAHLLGFFRRICKLLFLRTKPVFVFDGGTPALKRRTVIARRRQRENAQAKVRKTAEKLLLNHIKAMRVKELAMDLEKQRQNNNDIKGKKPILDETDLKQTAKGDDLATKSYNQEELDEMLAASLAAEQDGFGADVSTSGAGIRDEEDDEDEDEEMILPEMQGKIDPAVLASLPPSMQLDLLVQMRERLMAENRQKYQKVKKAPERFSELQIQAYLKTVAFRREIDEVQKSAAGRGVGGVQTSRIASEANRKFIFSSSFTGNRETLTSTGQAGTSVEQSQGLPVNSSAKSVNETDASKSSNAATGSSVDEPSGAFHDDVETYLDDRGRLRVSRVRALGIRMTCDLQRNLDLMKEIEQEKIYEKQEHTQKGVDKNDETGEPEVKNGTPIEVSFEDIRERDSGNDNDDDLFTHLVGGDPVLGFSALTDDIKAVNKPSQMEGGVSDEDEVEWEEGAVDIPEKASLGLDKTQKTIRKGALEEEAEFQEAIRRSLENVVDHRNSSEPCEDHESRRAGEAVSEDIDWEPVPEDNKKPEMEVPSQGIIHPPESPDIMNISGNNSSKDKSIMHTEVGAGESKLKEKFSMQDTDVNEALRREIPVGSEAPLDETMMNENEKSGSRGADGQMVKENVDVCIRGVAHGSSTISAVPSYSEKSLPIKLHKFQIADAKHDVFQAITDDDSRDTADLGKLSAKDSTIDENSAQNLKFCHFSMENKEPAENGGFMDEEEHEVTKAYLEDELLGLDKEREELGSEQRKLERNAESVSSEMFVECQELLQMFGLPYIIAPMEAEAQCAYMELANLVDGVVTDDSDVLLFGARSVYKNIFDDRKYVETYFMKDIENELGLDREQLIRMALLLGSDYTEGVSGIGIVNAIEVVNAFPEKGGLCEFREWIESPDPNILGKFNSKEGNNSNNKGSKNGDSSNDAEAVSEPVNDAQKIKQIFMDKHRNVSKNWHIPSTFPSDAVISAYTSPQVDKSTEPFTWGKPDLFVLRKLCWEKFGWGASKADELLLPVLKEYNKRETQLRLEAFYTFNERFAKIRSRRITKAVQGIAGNRASGLMDDTVQQRSRTGKKRKMNNADDEANISVEGSSGLEKEGNGNEKNTATAKQSKGRRTKQKNNPEQFMQVESCSKNRRESQARKRGRGRGGQNGNSRRKKSPSSSDDKTSSDDHSVSEKEQEKQFGLSDGTHQVRRSERSRKVVSYTVSDESDKDDREDEEDENYNKDSTAKELFIDKKDTRPIEAHENELDLEVGGGFCVDEMEPENSMMTGGNTTQTSGPSVETQWSDEYLKFGGGFCSGKEDQKADGSKVPTLVEDIEDDETENDLSRPLQAMPNLRRKRKKN